MTEQRSSGGRKLSGDTPIQDPAEDLLGFRPFADALAAGLVERVPDDGFVVGLQARWGMGKTSAVNLTLAAIRERAKHLPKGEIFIIQHFNPWFFSGVQALTDGYLSALGDGVEQALAANAGMFRRSWGWLRQSGSKVPTHAEVIGASVAGAATLLSAGAAAPLSGAVKGTVVNALRRSHNPALAKRFKKLMARLNKMSGRVVVVVDDLDRLEPADLRQVLTLIKTFGNLPLVTHLLVYDRDIVDAALADSRAKDESRRLPTYREKIVQAEFDLPGATEEGLRKIIAREVDPLIKDEPDFDQMDWFYAVDLANLYLKSPRDVVRFTNGLSVAWPSVAGEGYFPDLFVIELWRLFERPLYDALRDHKAVATGDRMSLTLGDKERTQVGEFIITRVSDSRRETVGRMLHRIFPEMAKDLPGGMSAWGYSSVKDRRRIGRTLGFDTYFRLAPPEGEYSMAEIRELRRSLEDEVALRSAFVAAKGRQLPNGRSTFVGKLLDALAAILADESEEQPESPVPALNVVLSEAEQILEGAKNESIFTTWWRGRPMIAHLVRLLLGKLSPAERLPALRNALAGAGLSARAVVIISQYQAHNPKLTDKERSRVDDSSLEADEAEALAREFVADLEADPDRIISMSDPWQALSLWNDFRGPEPVKAWIDSRFSDPRLVVLLADMVLAHVQSTAGEYRELRGPVDWEFYDLQRVRDAAVALAGKDSFNENDLPLIDTFIREANGQLEREAAGTSADSGDDVC